MCDRTCAAPGFLWQPFGAKQTLHAADCSIQTEFVCPSGSPAAPPAARPGAREQIREIDTGASKATAVGVDEFSTYCEELDIAFLVCLDEGAQAQL